MQNPIDPTLVSIRDLSNAEIPSMLDYWFRSPPGYLEAMGVDLQKMQKESEMKAGLTDRLRKNAELPMSKLTSVVIAYDGKPIGFHAINPLVEGDYAVFHAHIWAPDFRSRGIGLHSYPKACRLFLDRFHLNRIVFKTPIQNKGAIRVKEKLGIRCLGEELIGFSIIKDGTRAKVFELTREEAQRLESPGL